MIISSRLTGIAASVEARIPCASASFSPTSRCISPSAQAAFGIQFGSAIASPTDLDFPLSTPVHDRFFSVAETHTFTPRLLNEFRFGFVDISDDIDNVPIVSLNDLGISRPNSNVDTNIYRLELASFSIGPNTNYNTSQAQNNFTFLDTVSYSTGRHLMRFGGEADRILLNKDFPQLFNGFAGFVPTPATSHHSRSHRFSEFSDGRARIFRQRQWRYQPRVPHQRLRAFLPG